MSPTAAFPPPCCPPSVADGEGLVGLGLELELFVERESEEVDENGFEKLEDGTEVGKESEVLVDACAQNCCATLSTGGRSSGVHSCEMHATSEFAKRVALGIWVRIYARRGS